MGRETEAQIAQLYAALDKASAEIERQEREIDALKHDIARHVEIASNEATARIAAESQLDAERAAREKQAELIARFRDFVRRFDDIPGFQVTAKRLLADPEEPT